MDKQRQNTAIRVLVVDDSILMSRQISNILASAGGIEVVGRAKDGVEAVGMVKELKPDVVTMDVEMPRMNGLTALKHIMVKHPVPTIMISALTTEGARTTFDAFKYGAIDVVAKPSRREDTDLAVQKADIIAKVKRAAAISTGRLRYIRVSGALGQANPNGSGAADDTCRIIAMGAGTGGNYALLRVVPVMPAGFQGVLVAVVLMTPRYLGPFVAFLASHCAIPVKVAEAETVVQKGICYVCSGQELLALAKVTGGNMVFRKIGPEDDNPHDNDSGAIDAMFKSVAQIAGPRAVGVVMSGPGIDGADGLSEIRNRGGVSAIQEINNCTDPSMPLAALEKGFVERVLPDYQMADFLVSLV
jgi:two-component system, chemotaxis family, protein-glutamate methylesterase/glutaminase